MWYSNVTGKYSLHEETDRNGEILCEYAFANNMITISTQFQLKQIQQATWTSPDQTTINQIDHVLINANKKRSN